MSGFLASVCVAPTVSRAGLLRMTCGSFCNGIHALLRMLAGLGEQTICTLYELFSASIAMSNISLFAGGMIHQGHERFGDVSRGRQYASMSL